jgi:hypothetical protein
MKEYLVTVTVEVERTYLVKANTEEEAKNPDKWTVLEDSSEGQEVFSCIEENN